MCPTPPRAHHGVGCAGSVGRDRSGRARSVPPRGRRRRIGALRAGLNGGEGGDGRCVMAPGRTAHREPSRYGRWCRGRDGGWRRSPPPPRDGGRGRRRRPSLWHWRGGRNGPSYNRPFPCTWARYRGSEGRTASLGRGIGPQAGGCGWVGCRCCPRGASRHARRSGCGWAASAAG